MYTQMAVDHGIRRPRSLTDLVGRTVVRHMVDDRRATGCDSSPDIGNMNVDIV